MKIQEMAKILGRAYLTYPQLDLDDATIAAWFADFREFDAADFEKALKEARFTGGDFFPSPAAVYKVLEKTAEKSKKREYSHATKEEKEAQLRADWKDGIVWIVEHLEDRKVITKELRKYAESEIWADKKLRKFMTNDGVISYHFGEFLP